MEPFVFVWGLLLMFSGYFVYVHAKVVTAVSRDNDTEHPYGECFFLGKIEIRVHLTLAESLDSKLNKYSATLHSPESGMIPANCSVGKAGVVLYSDDKNLGVSMVFQAKNGTDGQSWEISKLAVIPNDANTQNLDDDVIAKRGFERSPGLMLFQTPFNRTIVCDTNQRIVFNSEKTHAAVVFSHVGIEPHATKGGNYNEKGFLCPKAIQDHTTNARNAQIFVPVILSVSLAVVVSLLVIGYLIHRKIEGLGYTTME